MKKPQGSKCNYSKIFDRLRPAREICEMKIMIKYNIEQPIANGSSQTPWSLLAATHFYLVKYGRG